MDREAFGGGKEDEAGVGGWLGTGVEDRRARGKSPWVQLRCPRH
jgi:hypothetical protein